MINDSIARNRLGLGARLDDKPVADPRRWLLAQLDDYEPLPPPWRAIERTPMRVAQWTEQQAAIRNAPEAQRASVRADSSEARPYSRHGGNSPIGTASPSISAASSAAACG